MLSFNMKHLYGLFYRSIPPPPSAPAPVPFPRCDDISSQGYPNNYPNFHLYTWVARDNMTVKYPAQGHKITNPTRARNPTSRYGIQCTGAQTSRHCVSRIERNSDSGVPCLRSQNHEPDLSIRDPVHRCTNQSPLRLPH